MEDSAGNVTAFSKAGFFSRVSFCWLNSLMKLGRKKTLVEDDLPELCDIERAGHCYSQFIDQLSKTRKNKEVESITESSVLWTIILCHRKEILISGFFALLRIVAISATPLLLKSFIQISEGHKQDFRYQSYVLAISLFVSKMVESLSQRQWYFRVGLIVIKTRSMINANIYKKQLELSHEAKGAHSNGAIMNYAAVDAYRIGEFSFWFHHTWTTAIQLIIAIAIMIHTVKLATLAALAVIGLVLVLNIPIPKLQHKFQKKLMSAQDARLKACSEALVNMKVLKLYAWETHFMAKIEKLRKVELKWLLAMQLQRTYNLCLCWMSPIWVSAATLGACYFLRVPMHASNVFTFFATVRLVQEPIKIIPDIIGAVIQAKVSFSRIVKFLAAPELQNDDIRKMKSDSNDHAILIKSSSLSWDVNSKPTLTNITLDVHPGEKIAICGEVGSGKSTLLTAILGEVPRIDGTVEVYGRIAYVSQSAWIQRGTIRDNILFGSAMDDLRYRETLHCCSLEKDLELLPYGDMTEIGERGINLSGGQKQRIQLARALYQDADVYLLDDPFSAVDAHTATSLFNEYVVGALAGKTVLLVTHQVDFLPAFDSCLLMSSGKICQSGPYHELLASSSEFLELVNAHKETAGTETLADIETSTGHNICSTEIKLANVEINDQDEVIKGDQLFKEEEREVGDAGLKPYLIYLTQNRLGPLYCTIFVLAFLAFLVGQLLQNTWIASRINDHRVSEIKLIIVYLILGLSCTVGILTRALAAIKIGMLSSKSLFTKLLNSLFRAPMSFYDSTPLGRMISRFSSDLSILDSDIPFSFQAAFGSTAAALVNLGVLSTIIWQVLFITLPVIIIALRLQRYYFSTSKELMRLNGITKSLVANHLAESLAGSMTIRACQQKERFFNTNLKLVDKNSSSYFHNFSASQWLVIRIEVLAATVLFAATLFMVLLPPGTFSSGFIGMALTYGLSLNSSLVFAIQSQCGIVNNMIAVERLNQYMNIPSEAPEVIDENRPPQNWPSVGKVEIHNLQIRYRPNTPLVLQGISCTFEGGDKIGIVGRTGSGKTTLIGALFRLVEPVEGNIIIDGVDIGSMGLHDLRSRIGIIPQDPTLFNGSVRFNLDPLSQQTDEQIWEVLGKCQLREVVQNKEQGLDSFVVESGSNWSMGQRQLFCLGRALLRKSRVLVLDEATASIDNATDLILQKTIRTEFADCTVITIAHRIPTVMDCTKVLAISDGKLVEYDDPVKLMETEGSLFAQLVREYWSHFYSADQSQNET